MVLAQVGDEPNNTAEMLSKVATFMAQLSDQQLDAMESYLVQLEQAADKGDESLAQTNVSSDLTAIADYLVQLDEQELDLLNTMITS